MIVTSNHISRIATCIHKNNGIHKYHIKCGNKLIEVDNINLKNNFCLFQYMAFDSNTISPDNYAINVINILTTQQKNCSYLYYHFNPKCQWLPSAAFQSYDSEKIDHQIIHIIMISSGIII